MNGTAEKDRTPSSVKGTVLIVDDKPENLDIVVNYLKESGFKPLVASNGEIAIERTRYTQPDIILLDVMMPGMDGFETCRNLKSDKSTKDIPVIFMTALSDPEHKVRGFSVGGVDYITKPLQKEELLARVTTHLKIHRYQEDLERDVKSRTAELEERTAALEIEVYERKKALEELRILRNYLSNIIDSMPSTLIGVDAQLRVTLWNRKVEERTGITASEAEGKTLEELFPELPNEIEKVKKSMRNRQIILEEKRFRLLKGYPDYRNITIYPLIANGVEGAVIRVDDVTEKVRMEEQLRQSQKMDAIGKLAGGVAHDFNNMLGGIMGAAQLLKSPERNLDGKSINLVDMIMQAASRAADLTSKLLAFGRKGKVASTAVDFHAVIDDTVAILERTVDKRIQISAAKKAVNSMVIGDNSGLQNALMNIGINASHAMPEGGEIRIVTENIELEKSYCDASPFNIEPGQFILVEIRDTGCGIPPENLQKIFEPFYTTKEQGKGSGLGLAAVYGTVLDHNGAVTVYSEVGTGTSFHIYLPCSGESVSTLSKSTEVLRGSGQILLVDDEEIIRNTGKLLLEEMGYSVLSAENGKKAVELFKMYHTEIDLVIIDMIMPEMNGREAFHLMKEIDDDCKVVLSSGFTKDESLDELKKSGLAGFIRKPYRDFELSQLLTEILGRT